MYCNFYKNAFLWKYKTFTDVLSELWFVGLATDAVSAVVACDECALCVNVKKTSSSVACFAYTLHCNTVRVCSLVMYRLMVWLSAPNRERCPPDLCVEWNYSTSRGVVTGGISVYIWSPPPNQSTLNFFMWLFCLLDPFIPTQIKFLATPLSTSHPARLLSGPSRFDFAAQPVSVALHRSSFLLIGGVGERRGFVPQKLKLFLWTVDWEVEFN